MKKKGIAIALILMSIGFASIATVLTINGTINYGYDSEEFDVYFSEAILDGVVHNDLIDEGTKKSITFTTKDLSTLGDKSILEYQVMNNSKQYDATVTIDCKRVDGEGNTAQSQESEYTTITPSPTSLTVKAQESRKGTITVELNKVSLNNIEEKFKCSLTVDPTERDKEGEKYIADKSCESVAEPNLGTDNKLIPVIIDEEGNITKVSKGNENWYNYCEKKWANAVILKSGEETPEDNQKIEMNKIESMFVWIPKYKYRLWNVHVTDPLYTVHSIEIEFDTEDTTDIEGVSCATPMESGNIGNCDNGEYMTHPAFKSFGVDGFWVGKFETGYKEANNTKEAEQDNNESSHIIIKPNAYSWRKITVKNMFETSKKYNENLQSHMMKNTEWGAAAYLSHSIYGINQEITNNNNSEHKTGYAALPTTDQSQMPGEKGDGEKYNSTWNTQIGNMASTTGNITGVYGMRGGTWEYVAAYVVEASEITQSGFTIQELSELENKYFDIYDEKSTVNSYNKMILGDATGEMGPFSNYADSDKIKRYHNNWYADLSSFVDSTHPWFHRGGGFSNGIVSGQFDFDRGNGVAHENPGFRIVLSPANNVD